MTERASPADFLPFQQSEAYATAALACGARVRWLDTGTGRVLAVERGRLRLISRALLGENGSADDRRALRRMARWPGLTLATPEAPLAGPGLVPLVTSLHHALWDLAGDLRAGMAGKWRNRLTAAERAGLEVTPGDPASFAALIRAEAAQRRQRGYRSLPEGFSRALPEADLRVWHWGDGEGIRAAMGFVRHGSSATYHLGWGVAVARRAGVHAVMLTRAAEALRAEGVRWLDLGTVDTEQAPGLARFKLGTGARLRRLGATVLVLP